METVKPSKRAVPTPKSLGTCFSASKERLSFQPPRASCLPQNHPLGSAEGWERSEAGQEADVVILNTARKQITGQKQTTNFREGGSNQDAYLYLLRKQTFKDIYSQFYCTFKVFITLKCTYLPMDFLGIIWKFFNAFHIATNMITRKVSHIDYTNNESADNTGK